MHWRSAARWLVRYLGAIGTTATMDVMIYVLMPLLPPPRRTPPLPLLASTDHHCACPSFPARTIITGLDQLLLATCSAFIARPPFVVTLSSIIVGRLGHTLHWSYRIIVDSFLAHPRLSARSRSHPLECSRKCLACDLVVAEYSDPCYRSRMACPINIKIES